jgi:hypothetical protein
MCCCWWRGWPAALAPRRLRLRGGLSRVTWRVAVAATLGVVLTPTITVARDPGVDLQRRQQARPSAGLLSAGVANTRIDGKRFAHEYRGRLQQMPNHQLSPVLPWRTFAALRRLPTDPRALLARLFATVSGGERPYIHARFSREEQHRAVF